MEECYSHCVSSHELCCEACRAFHMRELPPYRFGLIRIPQGLNRDRLNDPLHGVRTVSGASSDGPEGAFCGFIFRMDLIWFALLIPMLSIIAKRLSWSGSHPSVESGCAVMNGLSLLAPFSCGSPPVKPYCPTARRSPFVILHRSTSGRTR